MNKTHTPELTNTQVSVARPKTLIGRKALALTTLTLLGLMFVPNVAAEHEYSYHRTEHVVGYAVGEVCMRGVLDICRDAVLTYEYSYFGEKACGSGGNFVDGSQITVKGTVQGSAVNMEGIWYYLLGTYEGSWDFPYGPFVYTGTVYGDMGFSLWGENPTLGDMDFIGNGPATVTAETVQEPCPHNDPAPLDLGPTVDCIVRSKPERILGTCQTIL